MRRTIRAIVYGKDRSEAVEAAKTVFDQLTAEPKVFDGYSLPLDKDKNITAALADSPKGQEMIEEGLESTRRDFMEALEVVTLALKHMTPKQIMEEDPPAGLDPRLRRRLALVRHYCSKIGEYRGPSVWLYDGKGEGIRSKKDLQETVDNLDEGMELWVVPADVQS
jgi:hypothetical protein